MKVKTSIPFTTIVDGKPFSPRKGEVLEVSDEAGAAMVEEGLAEVFTGYNPNRVVVVNATLGNPFDDGEGNSVDPAELFDYLTPTGTDGEKKTQATAYISFSFGGINATMPVLGDVSDLLIAEAFSISAGPTISTGAYIVWDNSDGDLLTAYSITSGVVTDITTIAESVPCVLTVVYHPLPEE